MVTGQERCLRRLRALHVSSGYRAVGVHVLGGAIVLFRGWDELYGQVAGVTFKLPLLNTLDLQRMAKTLLGAADAATAYESFLEEDGEIREAVYLAPLDVQPAPRPRPPLVNRPFAVRWYAERALAAPLGGGSNGQLALGRRSLVNVE